jgi:hypothetical protein
MLQEVLNLLLKKKEILMDLILDHLGGVVGEFYLSPKRANALLVGTGFKRSEGA